MVKYSFKNDYSEGAHPRILELLIQSNLYQEEGYGEDNFCKEAAKLIKRKIKNLDADVHFTSGGTQANLICISSILKPFQSVISASTAHIAVHETGAIEATGHKINSIDTKDGKLRVDDVKKVLDFHTDEHMVKPKLVFISNSTELGSIYKKSELEMLSKFCRKNGLYLYLDGARLGSALMSEYNDLSISELSKLVDMFYIGGTKNGALIGEAIIINNNDLKDKFRFHLKQKGALLAKGRILGIQFLELFKNDLYFEIAAQANQMAKKLTEGIKKKGFKFMTKPESNQIFPILPNGLIKRLNDSFGFYVWRKYDEKNSVIRLVTSWATKEDMVKKFIETLNTEA